MNVLSAKYYAESIASDCGAVHWLRSISDSEQAKDSADYLAVKMAEALAIMAGHLGYRIEKIEPAPSPAAAIDGIRSDLAEIDGRAA